MTDDDRKPTRPASVDRRAARRSTAVARYTATTVVADRTVYAAAAAV